MKLPTRINSHCSAIAQTYTKFNSVAFLLAVLFFFVAAPSMALAAADQVLRLTAEQSVFQLELDPEQEFKLNQLLKVSFKLTDRRGNLVPDADIAVDGGMPAHRHGMSTQPKVVAGSKLGEYRIVGLKFHMAGDWRLQLKVKTEQQQDSFVIPIQLSYAEPKPLRQLLKRR